MSAALEKNTSMPLEFQQHQYAFAAHIRDPRHTPCPNDVSAERMKVYQELLFNNIEGVLSNAFPVLKSLYADADWLSLVNGFFQTHHAQTPYFSKLPEEFLNYLQTDYQHSENDPAFMLELAHYEWVELALAIDDATLDTANTFDGDPLAAIATLSPLAWLLEYRFPVHQISPDNRPETAPAQPTYLVVYRDRQDDVGFLELNPVTARLLQLISQNTKQSGREMLEQIASEIAHPNPQAVIDFGRQTLTDLISRDVVLIKTDLAGAVS